MSSWVESLPVISAFENVTDPDVYRPLPDDWVIGISDVVDSTKAIEEGRYKEVNLAGAGTISAVANALGGDLALFMFTGDGAKFAVPPHHRRSASQALARVRLWASRDLNLDMRVGMVDVSAMRAQGRNIKTALWQASENVRYAMFVGDGVDWIDQELKNGGIPLIDDFVEEEPDLTGLSCQWGTLRAKNGTILSLIIKPANSAAPGSFASAASEVLAALEASNSGSPVGDEGPSVRWPGRTMSLQARVARRGRALWLRRLRVFATTVLMWAVFRLGLRVGAFDPGTYRREVAENTDFRKFDDGLIMTVDCTPAAVASVRSILDRASAAGVLRYGLHEQDEALMTCFVPSALSSNHLHFVDGGGGGYAAAARMLDGAAGRG